MCSVCADFAQRDEFIPSLNRLRAQFDELVAQAKASGCHYHALVAYSGGKDSTYLCYLLKKDYDLNILAFTLDNGFISPKTFRNMARVLDNLGVDHVVNRPRFDLAKNVFSTSANSDIYPESLVKFGSSVCISCIRMVTNLSLRCAREKNIPLIMLGNSPGQLIQSEREIIYQDNRIPWELKRRLFQPLADKVGDGVYHYVMLEREQYQQPDFPHTVNPFPIIGYDEKIIYETIEQLGWQRPADVDACSTNCQLNSYGIVKHVDRHKFHPYDYEMAMLVRLGKITREEALRRVNGSNERLVQLSATVSNKLE
jgi:tRNA(Ile)-lysidine synthase TilS/MesJ